MGYVACLGQIPEETAHVLQNLVSANGLKLFYLMLHNLAKMSEVRNLCLKYSTCKVVNELGTCSSLESLFCSISNELQQSRWILTTAIDIVLAAAKRR